MSSYLIVSWLLDPHGENRILDQINPDPQALISPPIIPPPLEQDDDRIDWDSPNPHANRQPPANVPEPEPGQLAVPILDLDPSLEHLKLAMQFARGVRDAKLSDEDLGPIIIDRCQLYLW